MASRSGVAGTNASGTFADVDFGDVSLHCENNACGGIRVFRQMSEPRVYTSWTTDIVRYKCRNCDEMVKFFALRMRWTGGTANGRSLVLATKLGEYPAFGPATPARLMALVGAEREYFLKGRRAEFQGMGIAAFAYYRRVIDNQRDRILGEIIKVATALGSPAAMIQDLEAARKETQFSKAVEAVKHGIPEALFINGHNPLTLLYSALSEGLHAGTDEECLERATVVRVVMAEFAERVAQALKDDAELTAAINKLAKMKAKA